MLPDDCTLNFQSAFDFYRQRPDESTGKQLAKALSRYLAAQPRDIARYGPCLAMVVTLRERNHWPAATVREKIGVRVLTWFLNRGLGAPLPPRRPGWNDYYMVRWQLTNEQRLADEIHRRTHYTDPHMVGFTAKWMADSQRSQDCAFNAALGISEAKCGCVELGYPAQTV